MSALGGIVQLKSIAIEERPVWCLHWSAFSSQRECVWQLTRFGGRKWRSGLNRISHPDWVKLSVKLNCAPNQNTKFFPSLQSNDVQMSRLLSRILSRHLNESVLILDTFLMNIFWFAVFGETHYCARAEVSILTRTCSI